jgi:hypothetical protein
MESKEEECEKGESELFEPRMGEVVNNDLSVNSENPCFN